jgi:PKHD-type hydroxylase
LQNRYTYWLFKDVIPEKDRKKIKRLGSKAGYKEAGVLGKDLEPEKAKAEERSTSVAFSSDKFLYDVFGPYVNSANEQAGWNYDLDWFEAVQIARYRKDQHYSWHTDGQSDHFGCYQDGENRHGKVRKLSCVALLSNGYVGGDLELAVQKQEEENEILSPGMGVGDVIVFPSWVFHRSTPIIKGTKYSISMWCLGPPFR